MPINYDVEYPKLQRKLSKLERNVEDALEILEQQDNFAVSVSQLRERIQEAVEILEGG